MRGAIPNSNKLTVPRGILRVGPTVESFTRNYQDHHDDLHQHHHEHIIETQSNGDQKVANKEIQGLTGCIYDFYNYTYIYINVIYVYTHTEYAINIIISRLFRGIRYMIKIGISLNVDLGMVLKV